MAQTVPLWLQPYDSKPGIVISSRVRLARNLLDYQFPSRASLLERKRVFERIQTELKSIPACEKYEYWNFAQADSLDITFLAENRAVSYDMLNLNGDRGVVFDESFQTGIMINEEDHIRMQCIRNGYCANDLWEVLDRLDTVLGHRLRFAFDANKGFLTSCPTNSGTGLRVSFLLHLPALVLTRAIDQTLQGVTQMGIGARGFFGENSEVVGSFFQLSNQAAVGAGEIEFIQTTQRIIDRVIDCEKKARERIMNEAELELEDKVFRSYGILLYAKTLSVNEMLNLASALRIGIECGIFLEMDIATLNQMILMTMPAHIQFLDGVGLDEEAINRRRAEMVHAFLKHGK